MRSLLHSVIHKKIAIWGWQTLQLPGPEKAGNQKRRKIIVMINPKLVWSEPKFTFWPVCWFDVRKICMIPGDCDVYCPLRWCWRWWLFIPIFHLFWERTRQNWTQSFANMPQLPPQHLLPHVLQIMPRNSKYDQFHSKGYHNEEIHRARPKCLETTKFDTFH